VLETYGLRFSEFAQMHPLEQSAHMAFAQAIESDRREFYQDLAEAVLKSFG